MKHYGRPHFKALRLSEDELDKLLRISAITAHPGDFSKTVRYLIATHPEPAELAKQAQQAMAAQRG